MSALADLCGCFVLSFDPADFHLNDKENDPIVTIVPELKGSAS